MIRLLNKFRRDRRGNFGMMTAILLIPMLASAGLAIDYTRISEVKVQLQNAADAASVGTIAQQSQAVYTAISMAADGPVKSVEGQAESFFKGNVQSPTASYLTDVKADVEKSGSEVTSKLSYTATVPTTFMRIFGYDNVTLSGQANSIIQTATFMDFYLLLDNTPSMGIAATQAGINTMIAKTPDSCAFACHDDSANGNDNFAIAKANNVTLRIDVVAQAVKDLMTTAADPDIRHYNDQFRMAIYTFGEHAEEPGLMEVAPLSDDLTNQASLASNIQLMTIPYQGYNNDQITSFDNALTGLNNIIGTPGVGNSSDSPQKWVFMVSDGVGDSYKPATCTERTTSGRCQEPIDLTYCQKLKDRGVKIAVLYTTYLPIPNNSWYMSWIAPFQNDIGPRMQSCATPGYFFEVSPSDGISEAMSALFKKIVMAPRITS